MIRSRRGRRWSSLGDEDAEPLAAEGGHRHKLAVEVGEAVAAGALLAEIEWALRGAGGMLCAGCSVGSAFERLRETAPFVVVAHRGDNGVPENTVAVFAASVRAGAQMVEFDVFRPKTAHGSACTTTRSIAPPTRSRASGARACASS